MSSQDVVVCAKIQDKRCCFKASEGTIEASESTIEDLTAEERNIAEDAKQRALMILQDALKKKDKVLMQVPKKLVLDEEGSCQFWMERHAIVTEDLVNNLIAELKTVKFKKVNTSEQREKATFKKDSSGKAQYYAYVYRNDITKTIYLCEMFWKAPKYLEKDSQPGTLIHEVSHFLGTRDFTYKESTILAGCKGHRIKANPENNSSSKTKEKEEEKNRNFLESIGLPCINRVPLPGKLENYIETSCYNALSLVWNANNIEYEFELTIKHGGKYEKGKYSCCGESERYSVCECSVPNEFHTCDSEKTIDKVDRDTAFRTSTLETTYFTLNSRIQPSQAKMIELLLEPRQTRLVQHYMPSRSRNCERHDNPGFLHTLIDHVKSSLKHLLSKVYMAGSTWLL